MPRPTATDALLEREREVDELRRCAGQAAAGRGNVLVLQGPAGVGKTALLDEARRIAGQAGLAVFGATGSELERELAFGIARQLFERPLRELDGASRDDILAGAGRLAVPVLTPEPAPSPPQAIHAAMHGLYWLAAELAARRPLVLIVDDAHWADAASLRWLSYLGRRLDGVPLSLVIAYREAEPGSEPVLLDRVLAETRPEVLRPAPLTEAGVARWLTDDFGEPPAADLARSCLTATGGNPLLLRELFTSMRRDGLGVDAAAAARVMGVAPAAVARTLLLRLAPLGPDAAAVAEATALLSADARVDRVAAVAGVSLERVAELADRLAAAEILAEREPLEFRHPVLRAAVYEQIPPVRRGLAHLAAAERLLEDGGGSERAASHLLLAPPGGRDWVIAALRAAADAALSRGAPDVAVRHLRRALAESPHGESDVLLELAQVESTLQEPQGPEHARAVMRQARDPAGRARAALIAARSLVSLGRLEETLEVLASLEPVLDGVAPDLQREAQAMSMLATAWSAGSGSLEPRLAALGVDELGGETRAEQLLLGLSAMAHIVAAHPREQAIAVARRALAGPDDGPPEFDVATSAARSLAIADELDEARRAWTLRIERARSAGAVMVAAAGCAMRADVELRAGRLSAAEADAREALTIARDYDLPWVVGGVTAFLAEILLDREPPASAAALLAEEQMQAEALPEPHTRALVLHARGRVRAAIGDLTGAEADLRACGREQLALGDTNPASIPWRSSLALVLGRGTARDEAGRLADEELLLARRFGAPRAIGIALRAHALLLRGEAQVAGLRDAVQTLAGGPARLEHARSLVDLGAALRRAGHRVDARATLGRALDEAHRCDAQQLAANARAELVAAGARPRRERISGPDALTASERRIADMAANGLTNRQIAQALS